MILRYQLNTLHWGICQEKGGTMKARLLYLAYSFALVGALVVSSIAAYRWG
jgi:hypothetical protein